MMSDLLTPSARDGEVWWLLVENDLVLSDLDEQRARCQFGASCESDLVFVWLRPEPEAVFEFSAGHELLRQL